MEELTSQEKQAETAKLITELLKMSEDNLEPMDSEYRSVYLSDNKKRTREIGERLNKLGGYSLLLFAHQHIPTGDRRELESAWHGIGEWES